MGTFIGHIVPGLVFTLLGFWHTTNTIKSYKLKGHANFTSCTWYPLSLASKHLELHLILAFSALAAASQLVDYTSLSFSFSLTLDGVEHCTIYLHLMIYAAAALAAEHSGSPEAVSRAVVGLLAASVFGQELFLLHFHSADHVGLEGHYHWLLQLLVVISLSATVTTVASPASFPAAGVRAASVLAQGLWFVVMGFALWVPRLLPEGCYVPEIISSDSDGGVHGAVECLTESAGRRAFALANLQFSWMIAGVSVLTACLCLRPAWGCMEYKQLESKGGDSCTKSDAEELKLTSIYIQTLGCENIIDDEK